jgi:hypothetical protein
MEGTLGKSRMKWGDDKRKDLKEIAFEDGKALELAQNRVQLKALMPAIFSYSVLLLQWYSLLLICDTNYFY